jgi:peptidoglycan hydrolase-like protein with peptidoglycan-binding domain
MSILALRDRIFNRPWLTAAIIVVVCALAATSIALFVSKVKPSSAGAASAPKKIARLALMSSSPAPGATNIAPDAQFSLQFSSTLASNAPQPTFDPPVAGTWVQTGPGTLAFVASASFPPGATEQLSIPGGHHGMDGTNGADLPQALTESFTVAPMSVLRLQQLLAGLGYLPLSFTASTSTPTPGPEMAMPQLGSFSWRWSTLPGNFTSLWAPGEANVITTGAVIMFESDHDLATDGVAGPIVSSAILSASSQNQASSDPNYDFVEVATSIPEHVDVWRNGAVAYTTPANTGIEAAPTEVGTWPVYARYTSTTMSGTNPDGSHYDDPGVPWVSYFHGGDALHGFDRATYGVPQSLGCVEMPPSNAEVVFPYTPIGTLVTVNPA